MAWARRLSVLLIIALAFFGWGTATGLYKTFPWYQLSSFVHPLKKSFGIAQQTGGTVHGGLLNLELTLVTKTPIPGDGGGIAITPKGILIVRRADGIVVDYDPDLKVVSELGTQLPPTNRNLLPARTAGGRPVNAGFLRYNDLMVKAWGGVDHMIVSYSYFDPDQQCFVSRLDETPLPVDWTKATPTATNWRRLMETTPCLKFGAQRNAFAGNQAGGRMLDMGDGGILWTVGDYEIDGTDSNGPGYSQMADASYGKIFHLTLPDGKADIVSIGHRNPQGIAIDGTGRIWSVEHGPMGGDELNLIRQGANYGWPNVTLGVQYADRKSDVRNWPLNKVQGRHEGYDPPFYSWLPSIAPSSVQSLTGIDPRWEGDLLVSALADKSLHRLRLEGDKVLYDERLDMGQRVREIKVAPGGRIYILFDNGNFGYLTARPVAAANGRSAALQTALANSGCVNCHSNPKLPTLDGIGGTPVAAQQGIEYSDALKEAGGLWTEERLRAFLTAPQEFAPGASMPNPGLDAAAVDGLATALIESQNKSLAGE